MKGPLKPVETTIVKHEVTEGIIQTKSGPQEVIETEMAFAMPSDLGSRFANLNAVATPEQTPIIPGNVNVEALRAAGLTEQSTMASSKDLMAHIKVVDGVERINPKTNKAVKAPVPPEVITAQQVQSDAIKRLTGVPTRIML